MNKRKLFLSYSCIGTLTILVMYISGVSAGISFILGLCFYTGIAYLLYYLWKIIRRKEKSSLYDFSLYFLYRFSISIGICMLLLIGFSVYQNIINPARLPLYTLTNGQQTLRFQTMSHIASAEFYQTVQTAITRSKQEGYVLYYEGVRPGSEKSLETFNNALGVKFTPDLYTNLSRLYGIVAQNNDDFLGIENNKDFNVDVSLDEVVEIYEGKKTFSNPDGGDKQDTHTGTAIDINQDLIHSLASISQRELVILRFFNQSLMNFMMKNEALRDTLITQLGNTDIFAVILDERNEYLVEEILTRNDTKIHIIYGLMHFKGVYELLQAQDPRWRIVDSQSEQVIIPFER